MRKLLLSLFFCLLSAVAFTQTEALLDRLQDWETAGQSDSLDFFYPQLAETYKVEDQLADFLYSYWDWQAYWFDDTAKALSILDTALIRQWRAPANAEEGEALLWVQINRGYHLGAFGRILPSIRAYEAALQSYTQYDFDFFDAVDYLFLPLGAHYTRIGDNEKARGIYLRAIPIAKLHQDAESLAGLFNNLGLTYWNAGQYEQAINTYRQGLALSDVSPLRAGLLHLSLAQCFFDGDNAAQTSVHLTQAEDQLLSSPPSESQLDYLSGVRKLQGDLSALEARYDRAAQRYTTALQLARRIYGKQASRDIGKIYVSRGQLLLRQKKNEEALTAFNRAISSVLPTFQPTNPQENPRTDQLYEENTLLEALAGKAETYWHIYLLEKDPKVLQEALSCYDLAHRVETQLQASFQYESSKLNLLQASRQRTEKALDIIRRLYEYTPGEKLAYQALEWMERAKAVVLLEALQENLARNEIQHKDTLLQREQRLKQQVAYFDRQLILDPGNDREPEWRKEKFQLEQQLNQVASRLAKRYPRLKNFRETEKYFNRDGFRRVLLPHSSSHYLSYFVGEEDVYGLLIGAEGHTAFVKLGQTDSLQRSVMLFLQQLSDQGTSENIPVYQQLARQLSEDLLSPLLPVSTDRLARLCIAPDAWLGFLPFEALVLPGGPVDAVSWSKVDFLLHHYEVDYVYSSFVAQLQGQTESNARRTARLMAPLFLDKARGLAPLPGSREELSVIAPACSDRLIGDQAGRAQVLDQIQDFRILHFSTHALADSAGQGSRIELYDQALYLPDIYALRLQAGLVVLSACETGLGQIERGEGVMSLARAFTYAGAGGLVSSLWSVNAQATTAIMKEFYHQLKNQHAVGNALHRAKVQYLHSEMVSGLYKSPYYWAGFVYVGAPDKVMEMSSFAFCRLVTILWMVLLAGLLLAGAGYWWKRKKSMTSGQ